MLTFSTFSITEGLAAEYIERGDLIPWAGVLVVEGIETGDSRGIAPGALEWRELPLPFMVQLENPVGGDGHDGAVLAGRIDTIERRDEGELWATGFIDPTIAEDAEKLAFALDKQLMRGISVDLDKVKAVDVAMRDGGTRQVIVSGRIMGATATPFQAFAEAYLGLDFDRMDIAVAASAGDPEGLAAFMWSPIDGIETLIASAGQIPVDPPSSWFEKQKFTEYTPLTVMPNGQVFGHIKQWGTCHISFAGRCEPVPRSKLNYKAFRQQHVITAEGTRVATGPIVMDTVHPDLRWRASDVQAFYADTSCAVCDVVPYEDGFGIQVAGAMRPDVSAVQLRAFRGSAVSPDWRTVNGHPRECVALVAVNNSGFKENLAASAGVFIEPGDTAIAVQDDEVFAMVAPGSTLSHDDEPCCDECAVRVKVCLDVDDELPPDEDYEEGMTPGKVLVDLLEASTDRLAAFRAVFGPKPPRTFKMAPCREVHVFRRAGFAGAPGGGGARGQTGGGRGNVPRDDHGRWTKGGAGIGNVNVDQALQETQAMLDRLPPKPTSGGVTASGRSISELSPNSKHPQALGEKKDWVDDGPKGPHVIGYGMHDRWGKATGTPYGGPLIQLNDGNRRYIAPRNPSWIDRSGDLTDDEVYVPR